MKDITVIVHQTEQLVKSIWKKVQIIEKIKRITIWNLNSKKSIKPRLFDAVIDGENIKLEVKTNNSIETIDIRDVLKQIKN